MTVRDVVSGATDNAHWNFLRFARNKFIMLLIHLFLGGLIVWLIVPIISGENLLWVLTGTKYGTAYGVKAAPSGFARLGNWAGVLLICSVGPEILVIALLNWLATNMIHKPLYPRGVKVPHYTTPKEIKIKLPNLHLPTTAPTTTPKRK